MLSSQAMARLWAFGHMQRVVHHWTWGMIDRFNLPSYHPEREIDGSERRLTLAHLATAFFVWAIGAVAACAVFAWGLRRNWGLSGLRLMADRIRQVLARMKTGYSGFNTMRTRRGQWF